MDLKITTPATTYVLVSQDRVVVAGGVPRTSGFLLIRLI